MKPRELTKNPRPPERQVTSGPTRCQLSGTAESRIKILFGLLLIALVLVGCTTPDLKPFASATKELTDDVATGGRLAFRPLLSPRWSGSDLLASSDTNHPFEAIASQWELRKKVMEALLVYSASLESIASSADRRKHEATDLVESVKQLAGMIPGVSTQTSAAGDLIIFGLTTTAEVKADRDLRRAVQNADPAIQIIATILKMDFGSLAMLFEARVNAELIQKSRPKIGRVYKALTAERDSVRKTVAESPSNTAAGAELVRLDNLIAGLQPDWMAAQAELTRLNNALVDGKDFFSATINAIDAWASTHADIGKALENNRLPNIALLEARAETLRQITDRLKN
jgi:hypothetical protein